MDGWDVSVVDTSVVEVVSQPTQVGAPMTSLLNKWIESRDKPVTYRFNPPSVSSGVATPLLTVDGHREGGSHHRVKDWVRRVAVLRIPGDKGHWPPLRGM
jgi:hypothetical protein